MSERAARFATHHVDNQPPPLEGFDAFTTDTPLRAALQRAGVDDVAHLARYGIAVGGELLQLGIDANRHRPQLRTHDRYGHRVDQVEFHPAYHALMSAAIAAGVHAWSWSDDAPGAHVVRAALSYLHHQAEAGTSCPLTMTHAAVPVLRHSAELAHDWLPRVLSRDYDAADRAPVDKLGVTLGMGMTEKQGGSDVRSNSTVAHPLGGTQYELVGHKWFFSAPMSDAFLVLAQASGGLSCFLLPRWRPDGTRNALRLMRLKDKLGNWANASSEVEFAGALAWRIGDEGRGVATIIEMVALTRLDCMLGSAAEMRRALIEAIHHVQHRRAFGRRLIEQPLMREVLADLALELEAAVALAFRVARAVDAAPHDPAEAALARVGTAIGKYAICKRAPGFVNEAQECLGGAGYIEESIVARLYREAPLNSIWEGCGNIQCLDVLRALHREPACVDALMAELATARGLDAAFDAELAVLPGVLQSTDEAGARRLTDRLARALQAAQLLRADVPAIAAAFCRSRLGAAGGQIYGSTERLPVADLLARAWP